MITLVSLIYGVALYGAGWVPTARLMLASGFRQCCEDAASTEPATVNTTAGSSAVVAQRCSLRRQHGSPGVAQSGMRTYVGMVH